MRWLAGPLTCCGCLPVCGRRYPTVVLQHVLQLHYNGVYPDKSDRIRFFPVALKERRMRCGPRLVSLDTTPPNRPLGSC